MHILSLTFHRDVSEQALFLPAASALSLTHIMTFVLQPYGGEGEVQHPAVGQVLEGEPAGEGACVSVHAPAVQLLVLALLVLQGLGVKAVPLQLLVGVIVGAAAQGHFLLLQRVIRGLHVHAEPLGDGFEGKGEVEWLGDRTTEACPRHVDEFFFYFYWLVGFVKTTNRLTQVSSVVRTTNCFPQYSNGGESHNYMHSYVHNTRRD